jgi:hypothetical protein
MNNIFIIATVISFIFLIIKIIELRFIEKEQKPLKLLIKDTLLVYFSVICGYFFLEQIKIIMKNGDNSHPIVFTDSPGF